MTLDKYKHIILDVGNVLFHDCAVEMVYTYEVYKNLSSYKRKNFFERRLEGYKNNNLD
ncbi:MAG: hypothetical protein ACOX3T_02025 [Bdellovibrionota bacterium]